MQKCNLSSDTNHVCNCDIPMQCNLGFALLTIVKNVKKVQFWDIEMFCIKDSVQVFKKNC